MDKKNNSKKRRSKNMVKGSVSSKKMGKGKKAKVKKYATVDFMQSRAYNLPEGLKIAYNSSGKAVLNWSYPHQYTFYDQEDHTKHIKMSDLVFGPKRTKVGPRRQTKVVTPQRNQEAEDLFHEVFFGNSSSNL